MGVSDYRRWKREAVSDAPFLSVVIPTYNEEIRILPTIGAIATYVSSLGFEWELVVSDDGSKDDTLKLVRELDMVNLRVLEAEQNTGKGGAVARGVAASSGELILFADADQSTPIEQLPEFIEAMVDGDADMVIGSRSMGDSDVANKSAFRKLLSFGLNKIVKTVFAMPYEDTQCGFKLIRATSGKTVFQKATIEGFSFDLEILYIAKQGGLKVLELPVAWHDAPDSKVSGGRVALRFLADMPMILTNRLRGRYQLES